MTGTVMHLRFSDHLFQLVQSLRAGAEALSAVPANDNALSPPPVIFFAVHPGARFDFQTAILKDLESKQFPRAATCGHRSIVAGSSSMENNAGGTAATHPFNLT